MSSRLNLYAQLVRWDKPVGTLLLLWPTLAALWLALEHAPSVHLLLVFSLGTLLMRSAGCAVNDIADRDFDKHVKRTAQRPITSGQVSVKEALAVALLLTLLAFGLVLTTNLLTIVMSVGALAVTILYPFTKRFFSMPQAVLGVAFSFGIPMAYAAVQSQVPWQAWALLVANLFWVLAYDTEYAMVDRDDDLKIGMKTSAITLGRWDVLAVTAFYLVHLGLWGGLLWPLAEGWLFGLALVLALVQVVWHYTMIRARTREGCFRAFRLNHWLGFTLFAGLALQLALG